MQFIVFIHQIIVTNVIGLILLYHLELVQYVVLYKLYTYKL